MALNLLKIYTVKSNAQADVRKAAKRGECAVSDYTVVALSGGFRIIPAQAEAEWREPVEEATSPAGWRAPDLQPSIEDEAAYRDQQAEDTAEEAASPAEIVAQHPEPVVVTGDARDAALEAIVAGALADVVASESPNASVPPGLARLRADDAEAIRESVLADQANALADEMTNRQIGEASTERLIDRLTVIGGDSNESKGIAGELSERGRAVTEAPKAPVRRGRKPAAAPAAPKAKAPKAPGSAAKPVVSPEAALVLRALFFSPAFRDVAPEAKTGVWVDYKTINESDAPHGLAARSVPGYIAGLQRRGLVECRMDKPGKFSARMTAAGVALAQEAGQ